MERDVQPLASRRLHWISQLERHAIVPPHSGERLSLHYAIWACYANAEIKAGNKAA
jgi:hypothetical protein